MGKKEVLPFVDEFGADILLVPGRPGDGRVLAPGMSGIDFKAMPHAGEITPRYTHDSVRIGFKPQHAGLAIVLGVVEAAAEHGLKKVGGIHVEAQEDGSPFSCGVLNDPCRLQDFAGILHAVRFEGWRPDWRTYQPNRYGFVLQESVEWHHDNPSQVSILGSAACRLLDAQITIVDTQGADPSKTFYWRSGG